MPDTDISVAFTRQYETDAHLYYQRTGSQLRGTIRSAGNIRDAKTTFQKLGIMVAGQKARGGKVPVSNMEHTNVDCELSDWYAGAWVGKLDEQKIRHDERQALVKSGGYALGRKTDGLILEKMDGGSVFAGDDAATGFTKDKVLAALEILNGNDVPDDGGRYCIVGPRQWNQLLDIPEFKSADYVGSDDLPWKGGAASAKKWLGVMFMMHSGLTKVSTKRLCHMYQQSALGFAFGQEIQADITWHGDHAEHFVNNMMSMGACLIDQRGLVTIRCLES